VTWFVGVVHVTQVIVKKIVAPSFEVEKNCDLVCGYCTCHQGNSNKKKLFTAPRNRTRDMARRTERE
jgi:hypothetical protein